MQAVILAGGKGTRMQPLGLKPLLKVAGKTILEHNISQLDVDEIIVVVGHEAPQVKEFLKSFPVTVVEQKTQEGTYHALLQARSLLKDKFLVMNGDDLYTREDIAACRKHERSILAKEVSSPSSFGILDVVDGKLKRIEEKPSSPVSNLANTGLFVLMPDVFDIDAKKSERGEFELTDAVNILTAKTPFSVTKAKSWIPIGYPWDLLDANKFLLEGLRSMGEGTVEKGAVLKGPVVIGKNTIVKAGSYIEGPVMIGEDCSIGPNCFIRGSTSIGNNSKIGNAVEVKNCVIGDNVSIGHLSYFGDSVFGNNINIGAGAITANLRHDNKPVSVMVNGSRVDTGRRKLGCVIGDGVKTGIRTTIYPGRFLATNTLPGEIVK